MNDNLDIAIIYDGDIKKLIQNRSNVILKRYGRQFNPDKIIWDGGRTVLICLGKYEIPVDLSQYDKYHKKGEMQCLKFQIKPK